MRWIKHDTDANQDAKLQNVLIDYGLEGYGLYWYCIELIASKIDNDNITFELEHDSRIIARSVGSTQQKVEEMMRYFVETGLFEDSTGVITCFKLARRLDKSMTSNPQMREIIGKLKSHDSIMTESAKPMQDKIRLDKNRIISKVDCIDYESIVEIFNRVMIGSPKVVKLNEKRKRMVRNLFKFGELDLTKFELYLNYLHTTPSWNWAFEKRTGSNQVQYKECSFEYFMKEDTYLKAKEEI
jgi:hypothetical protein